MPLLHNAIGCLSGPLTITRPLVLRICRAVAGAGILNTTACVFGCPFGLAFHHIRKREGRHLGLPWRSLPGTRPGVGRTSGRGRQLGCWHGEMSCWCCSAGGQLKDQTEAFAISEDPKRKLMRSDRRL